jgi:hypothetical protein
MNPSKRRVVWQLRGRLIIVSDVHQCGKITVKLDLNNFFAHSQSDACALVFVLAVKSLKNIKDLFSIFLIEADAVVNKFDLAVRGRWSYRKRICFERRNNPVLYCET